VGGVDSIPSQKVLHFAIGPTGTSRWTLSRHHRAERPQMGSAKGRWQGGASHSDRFSRARFHWPSGWREPMPVGG
jgi:hypothetical protein